MKVFERKSLIVIYLFILLSAPSLYAENLISDIDKKYASHHPDLYANVEIAKSLCDGGCYRDEATTREALDLLRGVLEKSATFAPAHAELSRVILDSGLLSNEKYDPDSLMLAEKELDKALEVEPRYDYAFAWRGFARMYQENYSGAEADFASARKLGSNYPYLPVFENKLLILRGKHNAAIYTAIQQIDKYNNPDIVAGFIENIILAYENMYTDHSLEVDRWYKRLVNLQPNSAKNWGNYSQFKLLHIGDFESAIIYAERASSLKRYPGNDYILASGLYIKWAAMSLDPNRSQDAEVVYSSAKSKHARSGDIIQSLMFNTKLQSYREALIKREAFNYNNSLYEYKRSR